MLPTTMKFREMGHDVLKEKFHFYSGLPRFDILYFTMNQNHFLLAII